MKRIPVPVLDRAGNKLGEVAANATSTGASKIAGGPCEFSRRYGFWAWVQK